MKQEIILSEEKRFETLYNVVSNFINFDDDVDKAHKDKFNCIILSVCFPDGNNSVYIFKVNRE